MTEFPGERDAIRQVIEAGKQYGFGNMIDRLRFAWAIRLIEDHDMSVEAACAGAWMNKDETIRLGKMGRDEFLKQAKEHIFEG